MKMKQIISLAIYILLSAVSPVFAQQQSDPLLRQSSELHHDLVNYTADIRSLERFYFIEGSPERRERLAALDKSYLDKIGAFDFNSLSQEGKVDYILFQRDLKESLRKRAKEAKQFEEIKHYVDFSTLIYALEKPRRRGAPVDGEQIARTLSALDQQIIQAIDRLQRSESVPMEQALFVQSVISGLKAALKNVYDFYNGYHPSFTWWVPKPYDNVMSRLDKYSEVFKKKAVQITSQKKDASGITGVPVGRQELIRQLELEFIPYSPEELIAIANAEFAWCDQELLKATAEMSFGKDWKAALEKVKNSFVPAGEQPTAILDLYTQSVNFLKQHDLVTIPPLAEENWRMQMMTPERQLVNPFFLGGESIIISYPTNTMEADDKLMSMRGNNPHFSRATVHHELIAGHHLQMYMNQRHKAYRRFGTPFWIEGNALYWEFLLWDLNFPRGPEDRIGMLFWRMHRCARIIFSLNYHLGNWTPQQCIDFLVDRVGHERANASGEVRRSFEGRYPPLYQLAYMIGGLQFYALKKELVDGGKMSYRQYHDAILQQNSIPVELLRATLMNQQLTRDFKSKWKFYPRELLQGKAK